MATAETLLIVAAESRELAGLLRRTGPGAPVESPARFAREVRLRGRRAVLIANGPGPRLVRQALAENVWKKWNVTQLISAGFCGALDPELRVGDIVTDGIWSQDRVATTAEQKRQLRERTGARVVEMEYAAVVAVASSWGLPCRAAKVVSDTAQEDLPLDFNQYRDQEGRFQSPRIALAGMLRPFSTLPALLRLNRNSKLAAEKLGAFLADCKF
jgi:adenosylhomocysteine nucleosidase